MLKDVLKRAFNDIELIEPDKNKNIFTTKSK